MAEIKKSEAQVATISSIERRLDLCLKAKADRMEEAMVVLLAYSGYSIDTARQFASGASRAGSDLPRWFEDRVVLNVLQPIARTAAAILTANNPTWLVDPVGDSAHKRQAARGVQQLLDWFYRTNEMATVLDDVALRSVLTGYAGMFVDWDSMVGTGKYKDENAGRMGWFVVEPVDIFSWHHEPGVGGDEKAYWGIRETTMHVEEARLFFNNSSIVSSNLSEEDQTVKRHLKLVSEAEGINVDLSEDTDRVRVLHYFQKPGLEHPQGVEIVVCGNEVVDVKNRLLGGEFPVYTMQFVVEPHRDYGSGIGTSLLQLQRDLTVTWNGYRARRDQEIMPPWLVPKGSLTRSVNTKPRALNEFNPRAGAPAPMSFNPLSQVVGGLSDQTVNMMEYVAGINDASRGESPTSNATGRLTAFLAELDNRRLGPTVREATRMLKNIGKRMIRLWQQYGSETVTITAMGRGHNAEISEVRKADLLYNDIDIDVASMMPRTQPLRQETILNLLQMGVVTPDKALEALEFGGFEEAIGMRSTEALNARIENNELADLSVPFEDVEVLEYEEHETHLKEHIQYVLMEQPGAAIRARFDEHIAQHKQIVSMSQQAMQPEQPPGGAPPQAGGAPMLPGSELTVGGLPGKMVDMQEPGVDKEMEAQLASMAGI